MLKFFAIILFVAGAQAFWTSCNIPGVIGPDSVESPFCSGDRCVVTRGDTLLADAWVTPVRVHSRLDVTVTAFVGPIGLPLPVLPPHDDACNSLYSLGNVFQGCPTVPNQQLIWRIVFDVPAGFPAFNNARVRFEIRENNVLEFCADVTADLL